MQKGWYFSAKENFLQKWTFFAFYERGPLENGNTYRTCGIFSKREFLKGGYGRQYFLVVAIFALLWYTK